MCASRADPRVDKEMLLENTGIVSSQNAKSVSAHHLPSLRDVWISSTGFYGLVQAGRTWNEEEHSNMVSVGLAATPKDLAVLLRKTGTGRIAWQGDPGWMTSSG